MKAGTNTENISDDDVVGDSVRPWEYEETCEEGKEMHYRCYVCGIAGDVEEVEGEEDEVRAEEIERIVAVKDERTVVDLVDPVAHRQGKWRSTNEGTICPTGTGAPSVSRQREGTQTIGSARTRTEV